MGEFVYLTEAKQYLRNNFEKGAECPCCGQSVKLYKRKLNSGMARTLIAIYHHHPYEQVNVKKFLREQNIQNNHDWTLLKHWRLLEEMPNTDPDKKNSGVWKMTNRGRLFVQNQTMVPSHISFFNKKVVEYSKKTINIIDSLGKKFSYRELMQPNT